MVHHYGGHFRLEELRDGIGRGHGFIAGGLEVADDGGRGLEHAGAAVVRLHACIEDAQLVGLVQGHSRRDVGEKVGPGEEQPDGHVDVVAVARQLGGCASPEVHGVNVGVGLEEEVDGLEVAPLARTVQRGGSVAPVIVCIGVCACIEKHRDDSEILLIAAVCVCVVCVSVCV